MLSRPALFLWWLAVLSPAGEAVFLEYPTERACKVIQHAYERSRIKATVCQERHTDDGAGGRPTPRTPAGTPPAGV